MTLWTTARAVRLLRTVGSGAPEQAPEQMNAAPTQDAGPAQSSTAPGAGLTQETNILNMLHGNSAFRGPDIVLRNSQGIVGQCTVYEAVCSRVMRQDALQGDEMLRNGVITISVQERILRYLHTSCGPSTGRPFLELLDFGALLLAQYASLSTHMKIVWLIQDRRLREACVPNLETFLESSRRFADSTTLRTPEERQPFLDEVTALEVLIGIFRQQIEHLRNVQAGLVKLLPPEVLARIAQRSNLPAPVSSTPPVAMNSATKSNDAPSRVPLAPISANVKTESVETNSLKRKREDAKTTEIIDLCESDDEEKLQGQVDAINARIAAIRARTAHEDELMPSKKPRTQQKSTKTPTTKQPDTLEQALASARTTGPRTPDVPPRPTNSAVAKARGTGQEIPPAVPTPDHRIRIHVQFQGRPNLKLNISTDTHIAKIIRTARKHWAVPETQEVYVKIAGRKIDPSERIRRTTLKDLGFIDFHVIPAAVAPQPPLRQASIKPPMVEPPAPKQVQVRGFAPTQVRPQSRPPVMDLTSSSPPSKDVAAPPPAPTGPVLCAEQQDIVDLICAGKNVFYTGSAGCGKSTVLKSFVPKLRQLGYTVRIIAPTGKAALDINGSTTWTFAGWTPLHMKKPLADLKKAAHGKFVNKRLRGTDVLVIDEISMVENHLFERLNAIMKEARSQPDKPFGGVQLIVTGDFCQLPPVKPFQYCITCGKEQPQRTAEDGRILYRCPQHGDCCDEDKWAFRSAAWEECEFRHVNLTTIHRQSDEVFIKILQKLRTGNALTHTDRQLLLDHPCDVNNAVKLFPTRNEVKRINQTEFDRLTSAKHSYTCLDYFWWNQELHPHLESKGKRSPFDQSLEALREHRLDNFVEYKKDMLVVLLVNLEQGSGLVNGSQGRIVDFEPYDPAKLPKARREDGGASSSSKSGPPKPSQSRKSREGSSEPETTTQGELRGEYAAMREGQIRWFINHPRNKSKLWPVVEFDNGIRRTIFADCQINELGDEAPYTLLARTQIPLIAAWAMTIHKSQGMTLNKVIVDLGRSFEEGQEYVALSRARGLDGLKVVGLGEGVGKGGNVQVKEFLWRKFKLGRGE